MPANDESTIGSTPPDGRRPRPAAGIRAELAETPAGWVLTIYCTAAVAPGLRAASAAALASGHSTISVTPNLVPGTPFPIEAVVVAVDLPS